MPPTSGLSYLKLTERPASQRSGVEVTVKPRRFLAATASAPMQLMMFGVLAVIAVLAIGLACIVHVSSLRVAAESAEANTEQMIRGYEIRTALLRADASTTNAFLGAGAPAPVLQQTHETSMQTVLRTTTEAAVAQEADATALALIAQEVHEYVANVERARIYNRSGHAVGARYQAIASEQLRDSILPAVDAVTTANAERVSADLVPTESVYGTWVVAAGGLTVLIAGAVWLAGITRRVFNIFVTAAIVLVIACVGGTLAFHITTVSAQRSLLHETYPQIRAAYEMRADVNDAQSLDALTLISRGSGEQYQRAFDRRDVEIHDAIVEMSTESHPQRLGELTDLWADYVTAHNEIRYLDDQGEWDSAVTTAVRSDQGSLRARAHALDTELERLGRVTVDDATTLIAARVDNAPVLNFLLGMVCVLAATLIPFGLERRIREYG